MEGVDVVLFPWVSDWRDEMISLAGRGDGGTSSGGSTGMRVGAEVEWDRMVV